MSDSTKAHTCAVHIYSSHSGKTVEADSVPEACEEFCARAFERSDGPWSASLLHAISFDDHQLLNNHGIDLCHKLGKQSEDFMKFDGDKLRYDLITPEFLAGIAEVLTVGAKKYEPNNWRKNTEAWRYEAAAMRHFEAYRSGEYFDKETGLPHLFMAATNLMFLSTLTGQTVPSQD